MTQLNEWQANSSASPQASEGAAPRVLRRVPFSGEGSAPPEVLAEREWLITNGLGGYASGTLLGAITRRYHGLLIAALAAPLGRVMMLNQLTEHLELPDRTHIELSSGLGFNESSESPGFAALAEFRLEDGVPIWRYQIAGIVVEKKIFMVHGHNTTLTSYALLDGDERVRVKLCPHVQFRPHENSVDNAVEDYTLKATRQGFEISTAAAHPPLRLLVHGRDWSFSAGLAKIDKVFFRAEQQRGYEAFGELFSFGWFEAEVGRGEPMTLVASTEPWESITEMAPQECYAREISRRQRLVSGAGILDDGTSMRAELALAADQFVIVPVDPNKEKDAVGAHTIIAGYHWFTDWGRDTMISLEGLTLLTGRQRAARGILDIFSEHIRDGLIPNFFPEGEQEGRYHTADATLWFFHALQRYLDMTGDREFLRQLLPKLSDIVAQHLKGTRFGICVDPDDGLLRQGQQGYQLTWMDAKVDDWVVTPRRGKAVEINALWYNALRLLEGWLREEGDGERAREIATHAHKAQDSFNRRYWYVEGGYLYDVIDCDNQAGKNDPACRPNQVMAISLDHPVLDSERWRPLLDVVRQRLLTPFGLRSLTPDHPDYQARYFGDLRARDAAYHQGTVWAWLIGPFVDAWLKAYPDDCAGARGFLTAFTDHLGEGCIGTISEIFDAEPPFTPRGCIAQAWSVAEVLRCAIKTGGFNGR
ncbi:MAG: amylo-alpha-1,6-glucosidase [Candidatus Binatia bacterium]